MRKRIPGRRRRSRFSPFAGLVAWLEPIFAPRRKTTRVLAARVNAVAFPTCSQSLTSPALMSETQRHETDEWISSFRKEPVRK